MMHAKKMRRPRARPGITPLALAIASLLAIQTVGAVETDKPKKNLTELKPVSVTATGRIQRSEDVPYNISVLTGDDLQKAGVSSLSDLVRQVPGITYMDLGVRSNGVNNGLIIRGLNNASAGANFATPALNETTVSTYINSTPLFSNLKITDVERVEVLRGPQGTLYGSGSIGGTIRFIFNKPDPSAFSGDVQTKFSQTENSAAQNYGVDAILNMPLSDRVALRISTGYEKLGGVIDANNLTKYGSDGNPILVNPGDYFGSVGEYTGRKDTDDANIRYTRGSLLWNLTDTFSALLTVQHQEDKSGDLSAITPGTSGLQELRFRTSPGRNTNNLFSLELTKDFGFATLTSDSAYSKYDLNSQVDYTNAALNGQSWYAGFPRISDYTQIDYTTKRFNQELRLVSNSDGGDWDWVAGAYYSVEKLGYDVGVVIPGWTEYANEPGYPAAVAALGAGASFADYTRLAYPDATFDSDRTWTLNGGYTNHDIALYGELTRHLTDRWQITVGARNFWTRSNRDNAQTFPREGSIGNNVSSERNSASDSIFKFNTSYKYSERGQAYFTFSQGYRAGGANALPLTGYYASDPSLVPFGPDRVNNYEIGLKGSFEKRLQYSAALYYIDWKNMQVQVSAPLSGVPTIINAKDAVSKGLESELKALLGQNWQATFGFSYTDAHLTQSFNTGTIGLSGNNGDRLPGVPKYSIMGSLSYFQHVDWLGGSELVYRLDGAYRSGTATAFNPAVTNYVELGGFSTWNSSINWAHGAYRAGLFVNNLTNEKGVTGTSYTNGSAGSKLGSSYFIERPRTIGFTVGYSF